MLKCLAAKILRGADKKCKHLQKTNFYETKNLKETTVLLIFTFVNVSIYTFYQSSVLHNLRLMYICPTIIKFIIFMLPCKHGFSKIVENCIFFNQIFEFENAIVIDGECIIEKQ